MGLLTQPKFYMEMIFIEKTIAIMIGVQGAGKSTFCKKHLSNYEYVNLDTLKARDKEEKLVKKLFREGKSFVVDNTNRLKSDRERYIPMAIAKHYKIVGYYFEPDLKACLRRNRKRSRKVPEKVIEEYKSIVLNNKPSYDEGFDKIYTVINDDKEMIITEYIE